MTEGETELIVALEAQRFPRGAAEIVTRIAESARILGPHIHVESDYGDEAARRTPWELFDQASADQALGIAEEAVSLTRQVVRGGSNTGEERERER